MRNEVISNHFILEHTLILLSSLYNGLVGGHQVMTKRCIESKVSFVGQALNLKLRSILGSVMCASISRQRTQCLEVFYNLFSCLKAMDQCHHRLHQETTPLLRV